jgi:hypothetical protein
MYPGVVLDTTTCGCHKLDKFVCLQISLASLEEVFLAIAKKAEMEEAADRKASFYLEDGTKIEVGRLSQGPCLLHVGKPISVPPARLPADVEVKFTIWRVVQRCSAELTLASRKIRLNGNCTCTNLFT